MATQSLANLSLQDLRRALAIKERMVALEAELSHIFGVSSSVTSAGTRRGRRRMSVRARVGVTGNAGRTRRNGRPASKKVKRKVSAKARARLSAAAKARWAKAKAAGRKSL
jgi:hypothetical protein